MKTVYKIIFVLLAIAAAIKMFAGGGTSKDASHKSKKNHAPRNLENTVALNRGAAEAQDALYKLATKKNVTKEEEATFKQYLDLIKKGQLYKSPELNLKIILGHALLFNNPSLIYELLQLTDENNVYLLRTNDLLDGLSFIERGSTNVKHPVNRSAAELFIKEGLSAPSRKNEIVEQLKASQLSLPPALISLIANYVV